jgi:DNA repair ATPase RecN
MNNILSANRREELARMLGGHITEKSLQHADEMLAGEKKG